MNENKHNARYRLGNAETGVQYIESHIMDLPKTPGRDTFERGLATVREGLAQIKREAEL